jgi:hypothetical protein
MVYSKDGKGKDCAIAVWNIEVTLNNEGINVNELIIIIIIISKGRKLQPPRSIGKNM